MESISLAGRWRLSQPQRRISIPAIVPGCVHTDLMAAKIIDDPYYRDNEQRAQWIGETNWTYAREFVVGPNLLRRERVLLQCDGLDTLATIKINGKRVGATDNMFRVWEFDVKPLLKVGRNTITVHFASTLPYVAKMQKKYPFCVGFKPPHRIPGGFWLRKEPCNYGWDWGPKLLTCGIWRDIRLVAFDTARLNDIHIMQDHSKRGAVTLDVAVTAQTVGSPRLAAFVMVMFDGKIIAEQRTPLRGGKGKARLVVRRPQLWWPAGMGAQPLYDVIVALVGDDGMVDAQTKRIGLRTLRVERKKDKWGESFQFAANGVPFFAKGADWIPADTFAPRLTREHYEHLLRSSVEANMNMLRVWGGGIYEDDAFYDLCDELGLCVWQDFMFACDVYPAFDRAFMENVRLEVADNVRRLRHHPSLALWCGNNELEMFCVAPEWKPGKMRWDAYKDLFDVLIPKEVRRLDAERDYWPSSPHSPLGDRAKHDNPACGDAHLWQVWHGRKPFEAYRTFFHRFVSEFGFQSFPEPKTVRGYTAPRDRNVTARVMELHQRCGIGNAVIMQYMLDWFRLPKDFDSTLWMSQILQGLAIKYAVEHWRRNMPRCMGALYWQLNDCWPVASWASIDFHGRWKALHYMARRFFEPLLVSAVENAKDKTVEIHLTSDLAKATQCRLVWTLTTADGKAVARGSKPLRAAARKSSRVETLKLARYVDAHGPRNLMLWLGLSVRGKTVSRNFAAFAKPKHIDLDDPAIAATVKPLKNGAYRVRLAARKPALYTWIELDQADARFSDNFFHLRPGAPIDVTLEPSQALSLAQVKRQLKVRSLFDTYE